MRIIYTKMQKPLSSTQIQVTDIKITPVAAPMKFKSVICPKPSSCENINCFLSRLNSAMEEMDLDEKSETNASSIEHKTKKEEIEDTPGSSSNCHSSSAYEGSYYYDEQSLLDKISLLEL